MFLIFQRVRVDQIKMLSLWIYRINNTVLQWKSEMTIYVEVVGIHLNHEFRNFSFDLKTWYTALKGRRKTFPTIPLPTLLFRFLVFLLKTRTFSTIHSTIFLWLFKSEYTECIPMTIFYLLITKKKFIWHKSMHEKIKMLISNSAYFQKNI